MSYIRDWTTAYELNPFQLKYGNDYWLYNALYFGGNQTIIAKEGNTYTSGTTRVNFETYLNGDGTAYDGQHTIGVGVWGSGDYYLCGELQSTYVSGDLNFVQSIYLVDKFTGAKINMTSKVYTNLEIPGATGYMDMWYNGGTWYQTVNYDGGGLGTVEYTGASPYSWNPTAGSSAPVVHYGNRSYGSAHMKILDGTYSVNSPLAITKNFWYEGIYDNGSHTGMKDLTANILSISPITQYMYTPSATGVYSSAVSVVLKNDNDQWGSFTGYATSGTSFNPTGVFKITDPQIHNSNEVLFAGFVDYNNIVVDALNKTVTLNMNSVISGLLNKPIVPSKYINLARDRYSYGIYRAQKVGEILTITLDTDEKGATITFDSQIGETYPLISGELLTVNIDDDDDRGFFKVGEYIDTDRNGTGTFTVAKLPSWIIAGDTLMRNKAYPRDNTTSVDGMQFYHDILESPALLYNSDKIDSFGGEDLLWGVSQPSMSTALEQIKISPSKKLFGDEEFIDVLDDFLLAVGGGGFGAYTGSTVNLFVPSPTYLLQEPVATLDYKTDIYNSFTSSKDAPIKTIVVDYAYDDEKKRYLESVKVDIMDVGIDKKINTWMIDYNEDARSLAYFTSAFYSSGAVLNVITDTFYWDYTTPGNIININNIPDMFETSGTKFLVINRVYNPADQLVTSTIQEISSFVSDYFRVDYHDIGGNVGVL